MSTGITGGDPDNDVSVALVVVSHNSEAELGSCLRSLVAARSAGPIIVVDNASTDDSVGVARAAASPRVVAATHNTGFAGGCNRGFSEVAPGIEFVAFMNPDVRVAEDCFERCVEAFAADRALGCVAPLLLRPDGITVDSAGQVLRRWSLEVEDRGYGQAMQPAWLDGRTVLAACGALAVFRRDALAAVAGPDGPWAEHFFCFWEDLELGWRLSNAGWKVAFLPSARAVHVRGSGAASGTGPLRWRRPAHLEACIASNRWMTLIRHLHTLDLLSRAPILLVRDLVVVGAGAMRRPSLLRHLVARLPLVLREVRWRCAHQRARLGDLSW